MGPEESSLVLCLSFRIVWGFGVYPSSAAMDNAMAWACGVSGAVVRVTTVVKVEMIGETHDSDCE